MKQLFTVLAMSLFLLSCSKSNYQPTPVYQSQKGKVKIKTEIDKDDFLKFTGSTVENMIKYVSVDTGCPADKITVKDLFEEKGNALYLLDVCGKEMKYKRIGSVFFKDGEEPYKTK